MILAIDCQGNDGQYNHPAAGLMSCLMIFFFQAEDGIRDYKVTGVQTCALPIFGSTATLGYSPPRSPSPVMRTKAFHHQNGIRMSITNMRSLITYRHPAPDSVPWSDRKSVV